MSEEKVRFGDGIDWDNHIDEIMYSQEKVFHTFNPLSYKFKNLVKYVREGDKVIDCGCHIGRYSKALMEMGLDYTGVDQSRHAITVARHINPNAKFICSFLWDLEVEEQYDIAWFNAVLQHNKLDEKRKILERVYKVLRPGGYVFIAESTEPIETETQLTHDGWVALFAAYGFEFVETWHKNDKGLNDHYIFRKVNICKE